jgi:hypothetical protein
MANFVFVQILRNDPNNAAAAGQHSIGGKSHQAGAGTAVNHIDALANQNIGQGFRLLLVTRLGL